MALLPPADRRARIEAWKKNPRNAGRVIPVFIEPPGLHAPRRPTRAQSALVREVIADHRRQIAALTQKEMAALAPVFERAQKELAASLLDWIETRPDGELRWTAQSYRAALAQIRQGADQLGHGLGLELVDSTAAAQRLAIRHVEADLARFSSVFEGSVKRIGLDSAKLLATGESYIIPRIRTSAARYAGKVRSDLRDRLATDIIKGAPLHDTIDRLVEHGGPRGFVALQGVAGEEGALVEFIPEGLFARYRYWAERIVRTENNNAYNASTIDSLGDASRELPDLKKLWMAAPRCCAFLCAPLDGQVVALDGMFESPIGPIEGPTIHPNDRCTVTGWRDRWGAAPHLPDDQKGELD